MAAPLGVAAGVGAAVAWVAAVDPGRPGHYPVCPLLSWTGLYCPGCGGLRGLHALAHGDPVAALGANALAVAAYAAFAVLWVRWLVAAVRTGGGMPVVPRARHWWLLGGILFVFTVVRNLPLGAALVP
nr:DUF2752 domain-containing protein [Streptomyces cinnamoneus]